MLKENMKIMKDFFKLVKGSKIWIFLLFLGSILAHLSSLLFPIFTSNIIYYVTKNDIQNTYFSIALLALSYLIYNLFWFLNYTAYSHNFDYSYKNLREKIIDKIFTYDIDFKDKISKGTILNTMNTDVAHLSEMIDNICEIIVVCFKIIILIFIFLKTNLWIGCIVLLLESIYIKAFYYCNIYSTKYLRGQQKYKDRLTDNLSQTLNGLAEIKQFHIYHKIKNNFYIIANKWSNQYLKKRKYVNIRNSLVPMIIHFGKIILYLILVYFVCYHQYKVNMLILLIGYFEDIMSSTKSFMGYARQLKEWSISIERIQKILSYKSKNAITFGQNKTSKLTGIISFENVSFAYKNKNKGSIQNINFKIEPNQITALVGHSGSGKTTIMNVLLRKYKIDSGKIYIDDEDIYHYTASSYAKNVSAVNQSPFIFHMSIRKNLSLINPSKKRQIEACKRVGLHDYIMSLPKGYNTVLTENAENLSGGQKQLLALARTLLTEAEILILDEVTSALDPLSVEKIKSILENLKLDHTIIVITHKKSVMSMADKIIVLNKGKQVGVGDHQTLMKENPYYIELQTNPKESSSFKK